MFFSIIIPTFNSESTILECLKSILNQSFVDFEIIIQDGASTDKTLNIIEQIKDRRIRYLSDSDLGVYDAMNNAIKRSRGQWLYFLGSDDSLFSRTTLEEVFSKVSNTSAKVVYGDVKVVGENSEKLAKSNGLYRGLTSTEELFYENICHQAIFYDFTIFNNKNFTYDLNYPVAADYMLNLKLASLLPFEYISIIIANYNTGGLSNQIFDYKFEDNKWINIVRYFGKDLSDKKYYIYKSNIKEVSKRSFRMKEYSLALKAFAIYLILKVKGKIR